MRTREASLGSGLFKNLDVDHAGSSVAEVALRTAVGTISGKRGWGAGGPIHEHW